MIRKILSGLCLLIWMIPSLEACDLHNTLLGINPNYNQSLIGFRYRFRYFTGFHLHSNHSHEGHDHSHGDQQSASGDFREAYHTWEMWGRWYPTPKLQLIFSLPYSYNTESADGVIGEQVSGVGDLSLMGRYQLFNRFPRRQGGWEHRMFAGGGVKLPSGAYQQGVGDGEVNPLIQTGTGSLDFLGSLTYLVKFRKLGLSTDLVYRYNTSNWNGYRFANRLNLNTNLFYSIEVGEFNFLPNAGVYMESAGRDLDGAVYQVNTGGMVLFDSFGLDVYWQELSLNLSLQMPITEDLNGSQGANGPRIACGFNYAF